MVQAIYGSDNSSLWTPYQTGSYPITTTRLAAWIDGEDDTRMTLVPIADAGLGTNKITTLTDKGVAQVEFGQASGFEVPNFANGTASFLINDRNTNVVKKYNISKSKIAKNDLKLKESINKLADYREKVLNERFDKLVKGFVK